MSLPSDDFPEPGHIIMMTYGFVNVGNVQNLHNFNIEIIKGC